MKDSTTIISQRRLCNRAILFLRLFVGATMLLHIIGKMQDYNNLSLSFTNILGFDSATSLALTIIVEGVFAAMIMLGIGTRLAALLMVCVSVVEIVGLAMEGLISADGCKLEFLYLGIFLTLVISGGGEYAIDWPYLYGKNVPKQ